MEDEPRGVFDAKSLKKIVTLANRKKGGLKSRFTHPSLSGDGLGSFLGRVKNVRMDSVTLDRSEGIVSLLAVRGDLHLADVAFNSPNGDLGTYVLDLAEEDSDALSSSLVLKPEEEPQLGEDGKPDLNLPPLWRPLELHASDIVDEGAAVDGLLSSEIQFDQMPDGLVRQGYEILSNFLPGSPRNVVEARLSVWLRRAMDLRFGDEEPVEPKKTKERFDSMNKACRVFWGEEDGLLQEGSKEAFYAMSEAYRAFWGPEMGIVESNEKPTFLAEDFERQRRHKRRERVLA